MTAKKSLFISDVIHSTFINVSEKATEAAAASADEFRASSPMPDQPLPLPIIFNADHPFIFLVQQTANGNVLFMGRVMDPAR